MSTRSLPFREHSDKMNSKNHQKGVPVLTFVHIIERLSKDQPYENRKEKMVNKLFT